MNADVKLHDGYDENGQIFSNMYNVTFYDNDEEIESTFAYERIAAWATETNYYDLDSWVNQLGEANEIVNIYPLTDSDIVILPTLTKDNYEFLGWKEYEGTEILPPGYELQPYKNTNLYAVWKQSFNIKYNANFNVQKIVYNGQEVNHLVYNRTRLY